MEQRTERKTSWSLKARLLTVLVSLGCATPGFAGTSRLYPMTEKWADVLRVTEIVSVATRAEILDLGAHYDYILAAGIMDSELQDGSLAAGKVYCCGPTDEGMAMWLYVPQGTKVVVGDIVEVRMGRKPKRKEPGRINTAVRVRAGKDSASEVCRWVPPDENLWRRTLYCEGMEEEGWIYQKGRYKTWLKPADSGTEKERVEQPPGASLGRADVETGSLRLPTERRR